MREATRKETYLNVEATPKQQDISSFFIGEATKVSHRLLATTCFWMLI